MEKNRLSRAVLALSELMSRLRGPDGCPWDAMQTDSTIKMYLLEEAYEVLDAVENGSPEDLCQELGDLLFQIIFLARLGEEDGKFDLVEVIEKITEKMKNRHPHVFGLTKVKDADEVVDNWERIKKTEKDTPETSLELLNRVPRDLPALLRAQRLIERASKADFELSDAQGMWVRVGEEFEALTKAIHNQNKERIGKEVGDLLFSLTGLVRHWGLNAENLLRLVSQEYIERFKEMEDELRASGIEPDKATGDEKNQAWKKINSRGRKRKGS